MSDDLCFLSAAEAGRRIATRRLSPVDHVHAIFDRIDAIDGRVRAYITPLRDHAMAAARPAGRRSPPGCGAGRCMASASR